MGDIEVDENAPVTIRVFNERLDRIDAVILEMRKEREEDRKEREEDRKEREEDRKERAAVRTERERQQKEFEENNAKLQQAWESGDYWEWVLVYTWVHKGDLFVENLLLHQYLTFYSHSQNSERSATSCQN